MKKYSEIIALSFLIVSLNACSIFAALKENKEPDLSVIQTGASKSEVEAVLGKPHTTMRRSYGDEAVYQYFTEDERSYLRAGLYTLGDAATLCMSEFLFLPYEAIQGKKHTVAVKYDLYKRVAGAEIQEHEKLF